VGLASFSIASVSAWLASSFPDGLEKVAETLGFLGRAEGKEVFRAPMPDYSVALLGPGPFSGALAGILGTVITGVIVFGMSALLRKK